VTSDIGPAPRGELGRLLGAVAAFEVGNVAATLLIVRATELRTPVDSATRAAELALILYTGYNVAATLASFPAGHQHDERQVLPVVSSGARGCSIGREGSRCGRSPCVPRYWRDIAIRISLSVSVMRSPLTSTVTVCRVPVNRNGDL
jgi:hypothetical protein